MDASGEEPVGVGRRSDARALHRQLALDLGPLTETQSALAEKPFELRCHAPLPRLLRAYVWEATNPKGERAAGDFKIQLTLRGPRTARSHFDFSGGAWPLLLGWVSEHQTWVLWDAGCHDGFTYSSNVQVHAETIYGAAIRGIAEQARHLRRSGGHREVVIAARSDCLVEAIQLRVQRTTERLLEESV